jgi:hypothetical protein
MWRRSLVLLPATALVLTLVVPVATVPASAADSACNPGPYGRSAGLSTPRIETQRWSRSVSVARPDFGLIVGGFRSPVQSRVWDGVSWRRTNPLGGESAEAMAVDALSPSDAWAVGYESIHPVVAPWDARRWTRSETPPAEPHVIESLRAVSARSASDVWAVGETHRYEADSTPLIEHWNGNTWQRFPYEMPPGAECGELLGVAALAADDVWAVGSTFEPYGPLILHYDGDRWRPFTDIRGKQVSHFKAISAVAPDDIWAVGPGTSGPGAVHWDGRRWTGMAMPTSRDALVDNLFGMAAIASDDVWAVGGFGNRSAYYTHAQAFHWDGREWTLVDTPNPGAGYNELSSVSGVSSDDVWAVGTWGDGEAYEHRLYLHWDGERWRRFRHH